MKKIQFILTFFLLPAVLLSQQIIDARGMIVDEKGEPIIGATIIQKDNSSSGTISDAEG